jgi:hypothetical protein
MNRSRPSLSSVTRRSSRATMLTGKRCPSVQVSLSPPTISIWTPLCITFGVRSRNVNLVGEHQRETVSFLLFWALCFFGRRQIPVYINSCIILGTRYCFYVICCPVLLAYLRDDEGASNPTANELLLSCQLCQSIPMGTSYSYDVFLQVKQLYIQNFMWMGSIL